MREAIRFHIDGLIEDGLPVPPAQSTLAYVEA
jgi:predicted RNase H-like HicB family nuclease